MLISKCLIPLNLKSTIGGKSFAIFLNLMVRITTDCYNFFMITICIERLENVFIINSL